MADALSYRQIRVGAFTVGMTGLDELFAALHAEGRPAAESTAALLLARARQHNYIPPAAEADYAEALLREYRRFCTSTEACGCRRDYGTWRGHPRQAIPWYPTINAGRCDGCGACVRFCPSGVFAPEDGGTVRVVEPYKCQVGCSACVRVCKSEAIAFPPQEVLDSPKEKLGG